MLEKVADDSRDSLSRRRTRLESSPAHTSGCSRVSHPRGAQPPTLGFVGAAAPTPLQAMTAGDAADENVRLQRVHDRDHAQQIAAVRQAPGYPGSEETP